MSKPWNSMAAARLLVGTAAVGCLGALLSLLASCAAPTATPPRDLKVVRVEQQPAFDAREQGLVVGTIAGRAVASNYHERLWFLRAVVKINGVDYVGAINDGYLVLPLKAGEYELQALQTQKHPSDKTLTSYPIGTKFRVQTGRATNLGLIAMTSAAGGAGKFHRFVLDNTADITAHLKREQPGIFGALDPQAPVVAAPDTVFAKTKDIEQLRRDIARDAFGRTDADPSAGYAFGELGTIAKTVRDSQQRVVAFEALTTNTLARMFSCAGRSDRFVCSSVEPALYVVHGATVERIPVPAASRNWWVDAYAPAGIVLVDENMSIFRSRDDGRSWTKASWFAVKQPLAATTRIKAYNGRSGLYLYSIDKIDPIAPVALYSPYDGESYSKVELPDLTVWDSLIEVRDGLAVGPAFSAARNRSLIYVRSGAGDRWEERQLPDTNCQNLQRPGDGNDLTVRCSSKLYRSNDQGHTWSPDESGPPTLSLN